jgi:division protein CdvB (Snf7/Vps24/ESCRT-III family)
MSDSSQIPAKAAEVGGVMDTGLNEEAMKIIEEASGILEENTKRKFPDLPLSSEYEDGNISFPSHG